MSSLIELKNIYKIYETSVSSFPALKEISLTIEKGEMVAITGASGSGKSTLMYILGFLDHCTKGDYFFEEQNVSKLNDNQLSEFRNHKVGFIFQSFFLLDRLSALQNVTLPLFYRNISTKDAELKSYEILYKVGMLDFRENKPNQLSGGQQQRVAIARALVGDPDIILADEPTGALDSRTSDEIMQLLHMLHRNEGKTVVIVTHDQQIAKECDRIIRLKDGFISDDFGELHEAI